MANELGGFERPGWPASLRGSEPLRLAWLIDSLVTGGAERLVVTFAEMASQRPDVRLTVFVLNDRETPFRSQIEALGVEVVPLPGRSLVDPARLLRLVIALQRRSIEYLHAHLTTSTTVGSAATLLLGLPMAMTFHNVQPSTRRVSRVRLALYRAALRRSGVDRIAVGHVVAGAVKDDTGDQPCIIVPNAVSEAVVAPPGARERVRRSLGLGPGDFVVTAVGAIIGQKAYEDMLQAFAIVAGREAAALLLIAGDAPEPERLATLLAQVEALGLSERVRFLGLWTDIPGLLAASDLFVSSSHWEGTPVSLLEAMANGLACVVTEVGENARMLDGAGSFLVPARQPAALADSIVSMIANSELRQRSSSAVRQRVFADYSSANWVERLLDVYAQRIPRQDWRHFGGPSAR